MKPSEKSEKGKKCRVLANTIKKKPERNLNSSGNRSFLNKSTNPYITDLRANNARLAHSLALERSKIAELFRRYTECQAQVLSAKAVLRNVSTSIKNGLSKFRNGLDQMVEATELLSGVTEKVARLCPELEDPVAVGVIDAANAVNTAHQTVPNIQPIASNSCVSAASPERGLSAGVVPSVRQCAARPMVKGQVISNPTISLQRVTVPARHLGKGAVKPSRGVQFNALVDNRLSRLSDVPEAINESHENSLELSPQSVRCYPPSTADNSQSPISMPPSHVLLERIATRTTIPIAGISSNDLDEEQQLTVVHFGRINFSRDSLPSSPDFGVPSSPNLGSRKSGVASPRKANDSSPQNVSWTSHDSPGNGKRNSKGSPNSSQTAFNSSNSDEYLTESSSEDEELALQLAESKKCYLQRVRQEDLREGTSWNYDDAGKFRVRPPRKKKMKMSYAKKSCISQDPEETCALKTSAEDFKRPKGRPKKQSFKQEEIQESPGVELVLTSKAIDLNSSALINADTSSRLSLLDDSSQRTILDEQDMSLTECNPSFKPSVLSEVAKQNSPHLENQASEDDEQDQEPVINEPSPARAMYITQRSRGRKPAENLRNRSVSPLSTSNQRSCSKVVNNENSPPKSLLKGTEVDVPEMRTVSIKHEDLSQKPSYVVLERLPNNIIYRNAGKGQSVSSEPAGIIKRKTNSLKEDGVANLEVEKCEAPLVFPEVTKNRSSGRKHGIQPSNNCEEKNTKQDRTDPESLASEVKSKAGPKQSKLEVEKCEAPLVFPEVTKNRSSGRKHGIQPSNNCEEKDTKQDRTDPESLASEVKSKAGPKQSKVKRFKLKVEKEKNDLSCTLSSSTSLSPRASQIMTSAPASPTGSVASCNSVDSSIDLQRPRRHAAPSNFKEPSLNKKLRRE